MFYGLLFQHTMRTFLTGLGNAIWKQWLKVVTLEAYKCLKSRLRVFLAMLMNTLAKTGHSYVSPYVHYIENEMRHFRLSTVEHEKRPQLMKHCSAVTGFARACRLSLELIQLVAPAFYDIELRVMRQYFVMVCQRCREWLAGYEKDITIGSFDSFQGAVAKMDDEIGEVRKILEHHFPLSSLLAGAAPDLAKMWISMNIFHPVFAALASRFNLEFSFKEHIEAYEHGVAWLDATKHFRPSAIIIDPSSQVVGITYARRNRLSYFQSWEKTTRDAAIKVSTRQLCVSARSALIPVVQAEGGGEAKIIEGKIALEREGLRKIFAQHCERRK